MTERKGATVGDQLLFRQRNRWVPRQGPAGEKSVYHPTSLGRRTECSQFNRVLCTDSVQLAVLSSTVDEHVSQALKLNVEGPAGRGSDDLMRRPCSVVAP